MLHVWFESSLSRNILKGGSFCYHCVYVCVDYVFTEVADDSWRTKVSLAVHPMFQSLKQNNYFEIEFRLDIF